MQNLLKKQNLIKNAKNYVPWGSLGQPEGHTRVLTYTSFYWECSCKQTTSIWECVCVCICASPVLVGV